MPTPAATNELGYAYDAVLGNRVDLIKGLTPVPPARKGFIDQLAWTFVESPQRDRELVRLQKAVQSKYLEVQQKIVEAEVQGTVINPAMALMNQYGSAAGVVEPTSTTFNYLRTLSENCPPLAAIIGKRVEQVSAFAQRRHSHVGRSSEAGFHVRLTNPREAATSEDKIQCDLLEQMIEESGFCPPPDEEMPFGWQPGFDYFLRCATRDLLSIDWVAIRMWSSAKDPKKYPVVSFAAIDSAKVRRMQREYVDVEDGVAVMRRRETERTTTKREIVTVKVDDGGMITDEFTKDELFVGCRRPRTAEGIAGYGFSEAEESFNAANAWVSGLAHNATRFSQNSLPRGILTLLGQQSPQQIAAFAQNWKEMCNGVGKGWSIPIFHARAEAGAAVNWQALDMSPKDMEYSQFMFILALVMHAAYSMHPDETGYSAASPFRPPLSEASPESKLKYSQDTGLHPILKWWANFINRNIIWRMFPSRRYKFEFVGLGDWDEMTDTQMRNGRMTAGLTTPRMEWNDLDIQMPKHILDHPASDMPGTWPANFQLLQASQQADQQQQQGQEEHSAAMAQSEAETQQTQFGTQQSGKPGSDGADTDANHAAAARTSQMTPNPAASDGAPSSTLKLKAIED